MGEVTSGAETWDVAIWVEATWVVVIWDGVTWVEAIWAEVTWVEVTWVEATSVGATWVEETWASQPTRTFSRSTEERQRLSGTLLPIY